MFCFFEQLKEKGISEKGWDSSKDLAFLEIHYVNKVINVLISLEIALYLGPDDLRVDSIGTHIVENSIEIARSAFFDPPGQKF